MSDNIIKEPSPEETIAHNNGSAKKNNAHDVDVPKFSLLQRLTHNAGALLGGAFLAYAFAYISHTGVFTADLMNQYGQVVDTFDGSEIVADITTGGVLHILTTKSYPAMDTMVITIAYDVENIQFDIDSIQAIGGFDIVSEDNLMYIYVAINQQELDTDTEILQISYEGKDARWVQKHTVFIAEADFGDDTGLEDLVVFTNTPTTPADYIDEGSQGFRN